MHTSTKITLVSLKKYILITNLLGITNFPIEFNLKFHINLFIRRLHKEITVARLHNGPLKKTKLHKGLETKDEQGRSIHGGKDDEAVGGGS